IGGTLVADAEARRLPEFSVGRPPAAAAVGPSVVVEEPLTVIDGIGRPRASALARLGIRTVTDLATADPAAVASLHGVSDDMARDLIVQARTAVRERGRRVLFAPGQQR
ncbi:MAG TPA: helix-hairpin-helix domain-containing protein, partial [Nitriliruptorales bacterium]|nr:helix-hairpin-helix domain-containing protein [Nitriliruptorales bacterium]